MDSPHEISTSPADVRRPAWYRHEDVAAMFAGGVILLVAWFCIGLKPTTSGDPGSPPKAQVSNALKGFVAKAEAWNANPLDAFVTRAKDKPAQANHRSFVSTLAILMAILVPIGCWRGESLWRFVPAFLAIFALACLAFIMASQSVIKQYNFEYVLWALFLGLAISNTVGVPRILEPALHGELFIKIGLILLGAEILLSKLYALGLAGVCTSWVVTPFVLITTFWFGQRVLKIASPSLNMVISADMSVCGVSAAIATGAACNAKKEEISYAIGVSLFFTAIMMVVQPKLIQWTGMDPIVGAAWIGGTIDSTGAVVAAGAVLGKEAEQVATLVKMIQNILIGFVAFGVAVYWSRHYGSTQMESKSAMQEIWRRFPKFVLGFLAASIIFSVMARFVPSGAVLVETMIKETSTPIRTWLFCLAFVAIGLQTDFRKLWEFLSGSGPLTLYVVGQCWNLIVSLIFSYWVFAPLYASQLSSSTK